eukprot:6130070-Prymnesium_polylepis.1
MLNDAGGPRWSYESRAGLTSVDLRVKKKSPTPRLFRLYLVGPPDSKGLFVNQLELTQVLLYW